MKELIIKYLTLLDETATQGEKKEILQRREALDSFEASTIKVEHTIETLIEEYFIARNCEDVTLRNSLEEIINFLLDCC